VEILRRKGPVGKEILRAAEETATDMVMLGAKGRPRLKDFLVGTTSLHVLQQCQVPVLVVL